MNRHQRKRTHGIGENKMTIAGWGLYRGGVAAFAFLYYKILKHI